MIDVSGLEIASVQTKGLYKFFLYTEQGDACVFLSEKEKNNE